jgi:hypothetical protein
MATAAIMEMRRRVAWVRAFWPRAQKGIRATTIHSSGKKMPVGFGARVGKR